MCWGWNNFGKLGLGTTGNSWFPQEVNLGAGRTAVSISLGMEHACAILDDGSLKCWGYGDSGRLGTGSSLSQLSPQLSILEMAELLFQLIWAKHILVQYSMMVV